MFEYDFRLKTYYSIIYRSVWGYYTYIPLSSI
jgi:hypothetical protein